MKEWGSLALEEKEVVACTMKMFDTFFISICAEAKNFGVAEAENFGVGSTTDGNEVIK